MRFTYTFNSRENVRQSGEVIAADRDAAYTILKSKGIRPIRVEDVPGFWNILLGKGKRWIAIGVLAILLCAAMVAQWRAQPSRESFGALPRHHIYGDPALLQDLERSGFTNVFSVAADRYLARFAQPGEWVDPNDLVWRREMAKALSAAGEVEIEVLESDEREVRELKQIVIWMRAEFERYMSDGVGTPEKYVYRLFQRQHREQQVYRDAQADLRGEDDDLKWDRINRSLKSMGLPTLVKETGDNGDNK